MMYFYTLFEAGIAPISTLSFPSAFPDKKNYNKKQQPVSNDKFEKELNKEIQKIDIKV